VRGMEQASILDIGVLAATAVTAVFTGWAVWQRWRYTPRPFWVEPRFVGAKEYEPRGDEPGVLHATWHIENRGDGAAHDVRVQVRHEDGTWVDVEQPDGAIVGPKQHVRVSALVPGRTTGKYDPVTDTGGDLLIPPIVGFRARVTWRQHPNLVRDRHREWDLTI